MFPIVNQSMIASEKKKITSKILGLVLLVLIAGIGYLTIELFATIPLSSSPVSEEAAKSCQTKLTNMLIDETLSFSHQKTHRIPFSEFEINSWLHRKYKSGRLSQVRITLEKDHAVFSGRFTPFGDFSPNGKKNGAPSSPLRKAAVSFRIITHPVIRSQHILFQPERIFLGRIPVPAAPMPHLVNLLKLNPFEKEIRSVKAVTLSRGSLLITVDTD